MAKFGLIGKSLEHSFSKTYFNTKFVEENISHHTYDNYEIENLSDIINLIESNPELEGLNITVPYKQEIIPFLSSIDDKANKIGAVNVIKINRDKGKLLLHGYNTDADAFLKTLHPLLKNNENKAIILGRGGASKAIAYALDKLGIDKIFVSRGNTNSNIPDMVIPYPELSPSVLKNHLIVINTTPLGMYPNINSFPQINYEMIGSEHILYDLVYNPKETIFLKRGKMANAKIKNGYEMLQVQAEMSWKIWNETNEAT